MLFQTLPIIFLCLLVPGDAFGGLRGGAGPGTSFFNDFGRVWEAFRIQRMAPFGTPCGPHGRHFAGTGAILFVFDMLERGTT